MTHDEGTATKASPSVRVTFLGTSDAFNNGARHHACIALESGGRLFLIDYGATSLLAMRHHSIEPGAVDAILVSHLHGDHFGGLPYFLIDARFQVRRTRPLVIAGPEGTRERVASLGETLFPTLLAGCQFEVDHVTWEERAPVNVLGAKVTPFVVRHFTDTTIPFALRIEIAGKTICYSGDTEWTPALVHASRDADLFIVDSTSFSLPVPTHVSYATLRAHRSELSCRRVVLTHLGADMLANLGRVEEWDVAQDGLRIEL